MHSFPLLADAAGLEASPAPFMSPATGAIAASPLFRSHPLPMWLQDIGRGGHGRILAANEAALGFYGIRPEQVAGLRYADLFAPDVALALAQMEPLLPRDGEVAPHLAASGKRVLVRLSVSPLAARDAGEAWLVTAVDVTQQQREARLLRETLMEVLRLQEAEWRGHREAEQAQSELQALSRGLIELQERERRWIARELHDEIGQSLSAIRVQFAKLRRRVEGTELLDLIDAAGIMTEQTLGRVRNLSLLLHPPQLETLGLEAALRWHVTQMARLHGLSITFDAGPMPCEVDADAAIAVYRIVQEALNNVALHAGAAQASVALSGDEDGVHVSIADDGAGFLLSSVKLRWEDTPSLGLISMQERARQLGGELTVSSQPGKGTRIAAFLPWR